MDLQEEREEEPVEEQEEGTNLFKFKNLNGITNKNRSEQTVIVCSGLLFQSHGF